MTRPRARRATLGLLALGALLSAVLTLPALAQDDPADPADPTEPAGEPAAPAEGVPTGRVAGPDRIGTAIAIAQRAFPAGAAVAYLANADTTVDAVAGGTLTDGPILVVPACALPDAVADELARLAPGEVLALGGPAAVCDEVLTAAGMAAAAGGGGGGGGTGGDQPDHVVTATAAIVDASGEVPFTVAVTDPGPVFEGGAFPHEVQITGTDRSLVLDDPRFSGVLRHGDGQLVVTGRGCGPMVGDAGEAEIVCQDDFASIAVEPDATTAMGLTLHTDDASVGAAPLLDGTYVLDEVVRWEDDDVADPAFDDGQATIRITYAVAAPDGGSDTPGDPETAIVTWATPEGSFRTTGHGEADLARIAEGVERGEHIGIPNGLIHRGDGGVNTGRSWHLTDIELADVTMEVCDGTADYVEAHLEDFLEIGRYCPWGAVPTAVDG
jgi:hypothetical protein